jgi:Ca2+-binding EF-hand superfamily protein
VKEKLQQHLIKNDLSLDHLFTFIDRDRSKTVTIEEFTRGMSGVLSPDEALRLFMTLDSEGNKLLTYEELVSGCAKIHAAYVLHKMRLAIQSGGANLTIDKIFKAIDDNSNNELDVTEFYEAVSLSYKELNKHEVDVLFQHFDKRGMGRITKDEFNRGLNEALVLENKLHFTLHDFMTPLKTLTQSKGLLPGSIFDVFAMGR